MENTPEKVSSRLGFLEQRYVEVNSTSSTFPRAIKLTALEPIFKNNKKWIGVFRATKLNPALHKFVEAAVKYNGSPNQWGLERALDLLVPQNKTIVVEAPVLSAAPFRVIGRGDGAQLLARSQISRELETRGNKARALIEARKNLSDARARKDKKVISGLRKKLTKIKYRV